jgi:hypothetical protein
MMVKIAMDKTDTDDAEVASGYTIPSRSSVSLISERATASSTWDVDLEIMPFELQRSSGIQARYLRWIGGKTA